MPKFKTFIPSDQDEVPGQFPDGAWVGFREDGSDRASAWATYGEPFARISDSMMTDAPEGTGSYPFAASDRHGRLYRRDRDGGALPTFTVYSADDPERRWWAVRPDGAASPDAPAFNVTDSSERPVGRISRGRSPLRLRRAWTIEPAYTKDALIGYRGTLVGWMFFVLLLPLWIPLTAVSIVLNLIDSGELDTWSWSTPRRTKWRKRKTNPFTPVLLETRSAFSTFDDAELDQGLAYAQTLLNSHA